MTDWSNVDSWDDVTEGCPICGNVDTISPLGNTSSPILIIGEKPTDDDILRGIPFTGANGTILKQELAFMGVDLNSIRRTYMWLHKPNRNEECKEHGQQSAIKEAKGKQLVLLMGSDVVKFFTGEKVTEVNGLQVESGLISAPCIIACNNVSTVFSSGVGEMRFGLKKFVEKIEEMKLL